MRALLVLVVATMVSALCSFKPGHKFPPPPIPPYLRVARHFATSDSATSVPSLHVLSNCKPPEPKEHDKRHQLYREWMGLPVMPRFDKDANGDGGTASLGARRCESFEVRDKSDLAQLEAVSTIVEGTASVIRRSLRAEPSSVEVRWAGLQEAANRASAALWPTEGRQLRPELQAVLTYHDGDSFGRHIDQCEEQGQEGVLVVDLGLREQSAYENSERQAEFFIEANHQKRLQAALLQGQTTDFGGNGAASNWTADVPGAWIAFPMYHMHGVYPLEQRAAPRVVAVFTLIDTNLEHRETGLCGSNPYPGSCYKGPRPGSDAERFQIVT